MKILYIFPHPDDESFGPAALMHRQIKRGDEVYLLTLTRGGATKQRFKLNLSIDEMGKVRYKEMLEVKKTLNLTGMEVLDYPDSGLQELDPRILERTVEKHIIKINPDIIVSYPVHGISGFHDHLVMHAIIKRVYLELKEEGKYNLKRLAFLTLPDKGGSPFAGNDFRLKHSSEELIDAVVDITNDEIKAMEEALKCYTTYQDTIKESDVIEKIGNKLYFEFYKENFKPPLSDITEKLN